MATKAASRAEQMRGKSENKRERQNRIPSFLPTKSDNCCFPNATFRVQQKLAVEFREKDRFLSFLVWQRFKAISLFRLVKLDHGYN